MKRYGIYAFTLLLLFLLAALASLGVSFAGFWGKIMMVIGAIIGIAMWGVFIGLGVRPLIDSARVIGGSRAALDRSIGWTSKLFFSFGVLSLGMSIVLGIFAFISCGPAFLSPYYHWMGLAGGLAGLVAWILLRYVAKACLGAAAGQYASPLGWPVPVFGLGGVVVGYALLWLVMWIVLGSSVNESAYPASAGSPYKLPYPSGTSAWVVQGNDTRLNHNDAQQFSYDFRLSCGTPVLAARAGRVTNAIDTNDKPWDGGPNNLIEVTHSDGSVARYLHIEQGSALVTSGGVVQGQQLASVGSVGNSSTGHVHFDVMVSGSTVPVSFSDVSDDSGIPRSFSSYTSGNN